MSGELWSPTTSSAAGARVLLESAHHRFYSAPPTPITPSTEPVELPGSLLLDNKGYPLTPTSNRQWYESSESPQDQNSPLAPPDSVKMPFWTKKQEYQPSFEEEYGKRRIRDPSFEDAIEPITPARIEALNQPLAELRQGREGKPWEEEKESDKVKWMTMGREMEVHLQSFHSSE